MQNVLEEKKVEITVIGSVYETYNYEIFKTLEGNRDVDESDVIKLAESISKKYNICPIIVTSDYYVIDGQHRLLVCKKLNLPVRYVIDPNAVLEDVLRLNSYSKKWRVKDYLLSYKKQGVKSYVDVYNFIIEYDISIKLALCALKKDSGAEFTKFKYGKMSNLDIDNAKLVINKFKQIKKYNKTLNSRFLNVLKQLMDKNCFDVDVFIKKMEAQPTKLVSCATSDQYKALIEDIYNYRNRNKINLRY